MITIIPENLTITPAYVRRAASAIYGDVFDCRILLDETPLAGDSYLAVIDFEKVVIPVGREVCGIAEGEIVEENEKHYAVFSIDLATARMQHFASSILRPSPICLQVVRLRDGAQETILLDDIICLPSIVDGNEIVQKGDPINDLLSRKLDKPTNAGVEGEVISIDASGNVIWCDPASTGDAGRAVDLHNASPTAHEALFAGKISRPEGGSEGEALVIDGEELGWGKPWEEAQVITTIPAGTTTFTLSDNGAFYHIPTSAPIYTMPSVEDGSKMHEIVLEVKFSASALAVAFRDANGNTITPMASPTITATTCISFLCRWSTGLSKWCIMPVVLE